MSTNHERKLREAAARRLLCAQEQRKALDDLNARVRNARADGVPVPKIAEAIGTTRQRVYEILREGPA